MKKARVISVKTSERLIELFYGRPMFHCILEHAVTLVN